jgi:glycosyltransferase involved in cell wall biosynthesis
MVKGRSFASSSSLFHFIYPENSYYFSAKRSQRHVDRIVATYHQPVLESRTFIIKTDAISRLDGVILLSESQREFFEPLVGADRIFVVPHGIDLEYFKPAPRLAVQGGRIVAVGNWLRDFRTLAGALRIMERAAPDITCDVITLSQNAEHFRALKNVRFHSRISDKELLSLYHQAAVSVLALSSTAANNALLESLACGLPVIATDLPAIREYTTSAGTIYVPKDDPETLAAEIMATVHDATKMQAMGSSNAQHVRKFAWESVAEQTRCVYDRVWER